MAEALPILVLVRELLFSTKIATAARRLGANITLLRDPAALSNQPGKLLLLDLNQAGAIAAASAWKSSTQAPAIGFVSHVDADTARQARDAGIDRVLARSRFVEILPELLSQ